jgi:arginyl-tRNA synthetase
MIREEIARLVADAAQEARESGALPSVALPDAEIERPQRPDHGDYASSIALRLARAAGAKPLDLAQEIARHQPHDAIGDVSVAAPGFINFASAIMARARSAKYAPPPEFGSLSLGADKTLSRIRQRESGPLRRRRALRAP